MRLARELMRRTPSYARLTSIMATVPPTSDLTPEARELVRRPGPLTDDEIQVLRDNASRIREAAGPGLLWESWDPTNDAEWGSGFYYKDPTKHLAALAVASTPRQELLVSLDGYFGTSDLWERHAGYESRRGRVRDLTVMLEVRIALALSTPDRIHIGSRVEIEDDAGSRTIIELVPNGADGLSSPRRITLESPIGAALYGKRAGDQVTTKTSYLVPRGYTIIRVEPPPDD